MTSLEKGFLNMIYIKEFRNAYAKRLLFYE